MVQSLEIHWDGGDMWILVEDKGWLPAVIKGETYLMMTCVGDHGLEPYSTGCSKT